MPARSLKVAFVAAVRPFSSPILGGLLVLLLAAAPARAQQDTDVVAKVTRIQHAAVALQDALPRVLQAGSPIQLGDIISTGKGARLEMAFTDGTLVKLGARAQFTVVEYVVNEISGKALMRILDGAFNVSSGKLMQLADASMVVETNTATIGIRGTQFWGGDIGNGFEIALIEGKGIDVKTKLDDVAITQPGDGTRVSAGSLPPTEPLPWEPEKLARAVATISFDD